MNSNTRADSPPSGRVRSAGSNFPRDTQRDEPAGRYFQKEGAGITPPQEPCKQ